MRLPDDPRARQVLQEYLEAFDGDRMPWVLQAKDLDFRGAVLDGVNLQSAALHGACLDGVSLRNADVAGARLWSASLREADLTGAEIVKAQFHETDSTGAIFDDLVYAVCRTGGVLRSLPPRGAVPAGPPQRGVVPRR
jgi:uncharacterized protein YjbI with pentapeptide repeats